MYIYISVFIYTHLCRERCVYENPSHLRTNQGITVYLYIRNYTHTPLHTDLILITMNIKEWQEAAGRTTVFLGPQLQPQGRCHVLHAQQRTLGPRWSTQHFQPSLYPVSFCWVEIELHREGCSPWAWPHMQPLSTPWSHPDPKAGNHLQVYNSYTHEE